MVAIKDEVVARLREHYIEASSLMGDKVVGIFLQGSQNYGLDYEDSDVDTKCILVPSFKDIALAKQPISTTHIRENNEHIDLKDIRLYLQTFRSQNLNFLEILFTPYKAVKNDYFSQWERLVAAREEIAHMNPMRAVKSMRGVALEKYHAMEHRYPSRIPWLDKFHYDPKQLHHLVRITEFVTKYVKAGLSFEECMIPEDTGWLVDIKRGVYSLDEARKLANKTLAELEDVYLYAQDCGFSNVPNKETEELLDDVGYNIMKIAVEKELN